MTRPNSKKSTFAREAQRQLERALSDRVSGAEARPSEHSLAWLRRQLSRAKRAPAQGCPVPGCTRKGRMKGLCRSHYQRARSRGVDLDRLDPAALQKLTVPLRGGPKPSCLVPGCEMAQRSKGLCRNHYVKARKRGLEPGSLDAEALQSLAINFRSGRRPRQVHAPRGMRCNVEGCKRSVAVGYCDLHHVHRRS